MNLSDITTIREQIAAITERLNAMEAESKETITADVFEQKLINVFKAGLMQGRKEQYDEIIDCFRYGTKYIDIYAGNLNITGDIEYDDIGVTGTIEDACIEEEWGDFEVDMQRIDGALSKFKPEDRDTEISES